MTGKTNLFTFGYECINRAEDCGAYNELTAAFVKMNVRKVICVTNRKREGMMHYV
jgi:hypothetical protein